MSRACLCAALLCSAALPNAASATFPGQNGKLAFDGVYTMNPDGTEITHVTPGANPAWSPDGTRIAFSTSRDGNSEIYVMNADGSGQQRLTSNGASDIAPSWSPDGHRIVFQSNRDGNAELYVINADAPGETRLTATPENELRPQWSPIGRRIAFEDGLEISTLRSDGSDRTFHLEGESASWAPNGQDLWSYLIYYDEVLEDYFTEFQVLNVETGAYDVSHDGGHLVDPVVSPDGQALLYGTLGGGQTYVETSGGSRPLPAGSWNNGDWQPMPVNTPSSFARPKSANRMQVSLVPAFEPCTAPNREHGPPLAFGSCAPPAPRSSRLMVGVGDGHPAPARSSGFVRLKVTPGAPGGVDDTTGRLRLSVTNVMRTQGLSEYTGEVRASVRVRITDREGVVSQTVQDMPLEVTVPCLPTDATGVASTCDLGTDLDAILPGATPEGARAIWALDQVRVYDGGPDEDADTEGDNSLFAVQGVFVP